MSRLERAWVQILDSTRWRRYSRSFGIRRLRRARPFQAMDMARRYGLSLLHSQRAGDRYRQVETLCLMVGHTKSGGSMLGSMLDAHPRALFADELDAVRYVAAGFRAGQLYHLLEKGSRREAMKGRITARRLDPYSFEVPGGWQGRADDLAVIGDSKAGITTQRFGADPGLVARIEGRLGQAELRLVQVIRNPFDPISVMLVRGKRTLDDAVDRYFANCAILDALRAELPDGMLHTVRYENLVADPEGELRDVCRFLGLEATDEYLKVCAGIVQVRPPERTLVQWEEDGIEFVEAKIAQYRFLDGYAFDQRGPTG